MKTIRALCQEEYERQLAVEKNERRWALTQVGDSSMSDEIVKQQQAILDRIKKEEDAAAEHISSSVSQSLNTMNPASVRASQSAHIVGYAIKEQHDLEPLSSASEGGEISESTVTKGEETTEEESLLCSNSFGPVPNRYSSSSSITSTPEIWRPPIRTNEPSNISHTLAHANGQNYSPSPARCLSGASASSGIGRSLQHSGFFRFRLPIQDGRAACTRAVQPHRVRAHSGASGRPTVERDQQGEGEGENGTDQHGRSPVFCQPAVDTAHGK
ncbi:hypothetical protein EW146_g9661 [Bondarzewia mesenterica]|uniref:Uncharacterized protein n=1 Tax=Bondarzewia mesenterica TaxID=1095465 RepID=A0A4S4L4E2_9AGAM|nr:hypothetical protein EW146_g9661 [Bondarzewia mesenterica]